MTTPKDPEWLTAIEQRAWRGFLFTHLRLETQLTREMGAASTLSYTDYIILVALTDSATPLRLYEIANRLGQDRSRLSHHISRMVTRNLVTKTEVPGDRRGTSIAITAHGLAELKAEAPHHVAAVRRFFIDALTPEQLTAFATLAPPTPDNTILADQGNYNPKSTDRSACDLDQSQGGR